VLRDASPGGVEPSRITATLWVEPIGLDVLDDLIESNHLASSVREAMPRFEILPNRYGRPLPGEDPTVSLEWTRERGLNSIRGSSSGFDVCVESSAARPGFTRPNP
jgi:hypothetical protein